MRLHYSILIRLVVLPLVSFGPVGNICWAQTTLDRLEQQIRQRVSPSQGGTSAYRSPSTGSASAVASPLPDNMTSSQSPVYLGVTADDRKDRGRGVRITEVRPGSPAEKAGLQMQDLVTSLAGMRVRQLSDMTDILGVYQPGDVVEFEILRDGAAKTIKMTLGRHANAPGPINQTAEMIPLPPGELILPDPGSAKTTSPPAKVIAPVAQNNSPSDRETIEQLRNRIAELERRINELEKQLAEAQKNGK
jgi:PDZ domain